MNNSSPSPEQYQVKAAIDTIAAFTVCGLSTITSNETAAEDINALWETFFKSQIGQTIENKENDVIYAVYSDYEGDHTKPYRYTIGYRISSSSKTQDPSPSLHTIEIIPGDYAILGASGTQPDALIDTWKSVWESDLERVFRTDFEVYGPRFFEPGLNEVLVHIGIKENKS